MGYSKARDRNSRKTLPSIYSSLFESEEGKKEYEEWLVEQAEKKRSPTIKRLETQKGQRVKTLCP